MIEPLTTRLTARMNQIIHEIEAYISTNHDTEPALSDTQRDVVSIMLSSDHPKIAKAMNNKENIALIATKSFNLLNAISKKVIDDTAITIHASLALFVSTKRHQAVVDRLIHAWPWTFQQQTNHVVSLLQGLVLAGVLRIDTIGLDIVTGGADTRLAMAWAKTILDNQQIETTPPRREIGTYLKRKATPNDLSITWNDDTHHKTITLSTARIALLYLANQDVDQGIKRQAIAIDASRTHHDLLIGWRDCPKLPRETASRELIHEGTKIRLLVPGRSVQLDLPLDGYKSLHDATIIVLRDLQGWEGIRHWAALQRLFAVEGGRMGWVRWTLDDHMNALGYSKRTRESKHRQEAIAKQVEMLTKIELEVCTKESKTASQRPLLLVGEKSGKITNSQFNLDGMVLQINPLLYRSVRDDKTKKLGTHWLPGPAELSQVDHARHPYTITLGLILPIRWRWRLAEGFDHVALKGRSLRSISGIKRRPRHHTRAWTALERDLKKLQRIGGISQWNWKGTPWHEESICRLYPPQWVLDRAVRGILPEERRPESTPITGRDLKQ